MLRIVVGRGVGRHWGTEMAENARAREFLDLYIKYQRQMYVFLRGHIPFGGDIDDVFQDASRVLWEKFDEYRPETDFRGWAFAVLRLQVLKYYEGRERLTRILSPEVANLVAKELAEVSQSADVRVEACGAAWRSCGPASGRC